MRIYFFPIVMIMVGASCTTSPGSESLSQADNRRLRLQVDSLMNENSKFKKDSVTDPLNIASETNKISSQCTGVTKKGTRCRRMVRSGTYCWQHRK
jgi:hypothetical protein